MRHIFSFPDDGQSRNQFEYFRLSVALFSLFSFLLFLADYKTFLLPNGIINWETTNANAFWFELHLYKISHFLHLDDVLVLYICSAGYIISLIFLGLGVFTRVFSIAAFSFFLIFSVQLYPFLYGVDLYQSVFLLFLCVFPSGYGVAVAAKVPTAKIIDRQKIGMRGIQLYLMLSYFSAGLGKIKMHSWLNGKFLFLSMSDPNYQLIHSPADVHYYFYVVAGVIIVMTELLYFVLVLIPYARSVAVLIIIMMHLFIGIFMGLVPFGILLMLANIVSWYPLIRKDFRLLIKKKESYEYCL